MAIEKAKLLALIKKQQVTKIAITPDAISQILRRASLESFEREINPLGKKEQWFPLNLSSRNFSILLLIKKAHNAAVPRRNQEKEFVRGAAFSKEEAKLPVLIEKQQTAIIDSALEVILKRE